MLGPNVDWTWLGHAMWLVEAGGLRLLCDPLLDDTHHGGVFEVVPARRVHAEALRPDFVLVSHRHPDHFDVPSLARLARLDPDTVVVTPDALVQWAAQALGFRDVRLVPAGRLIELDGVSLVTTPSIAPDEWGVMMATPDGVAWNQVDSVLGGPPAVERVVQESLAALGHARVTLAAVRWQPMLEIAAQLGHSLAFPHRDYGDLLEQIAAFAPAAVVAASCSGAHVGTAAWLDRFVFPVSEPRFLRDVARRVPAVRGLPGRIGGCYRVAGGRAELLPELRGDLVEPIAGDDRRAWWPVGIPEVVDSGTHSAAQTRPVIDTWIRESLAPALARAFPDLQVSAPLTFRVDVAYPDGRDRHHLVVDRSGTTIGDDGSDWDAANIVAASWLWEVLMGHKSWGDMLLGGGLRAITRAYDVDETGLHPAHLGETFLYYALSYDDSVRRAVQYAVTRELE